MTTYYYDRFEELLSVLDDEQLIRFAYRLRKKGKHETAQLLDEEITQRENSKRPRGSQNDSRPA